MIIPIEYNISLRSTPAVSSYFKIYMNFSNRVNSFETLCTSVERAPHVPSAPVMYYATSDLHETNSLIALKRGAAKRTHATIVSAQQHSLADNIILVEYIVFSSDFHKHAERERELENDNFFFFIRPKSVKREHRRWHIRTDIYYYK